jgi:hypothetical protein
MFLNVKLEREWIFKVVNDKTVQFKTDRTERISWTDAWKNRSEKVSINTIFYFLTFLTKIMEIQTMQCNCFVEFYVLIYFFPELKNL